MTDQSRKAVGLGYIKLGLAVPTLGQVVSFSESNSNLGGHSETETANIYNN